MGIVGSALYVLYEDERGAWRVQAVRVWVVPLCGRYAVLRPSVLQVPVSPGSFTSRLALPETWRGLRNAELDAVPIAGVYLLNSLYMYICVFI